MRVCTRLPRYFTCRSFFTLDGKNKGKISSPPTVRYENIRDYVRRLFVFRTFNAPCNTDGLTAIFYLATAYTAYKNTPGYSPVFYVDRRRIWGRPPSARNRPRKKPVDLLPSFTFSSRAPANNTYLIAKRFNEPRAAAGTN